ncbi:MAG TPA: ABC transporter substrate-binding protein [Pilimelia sp.]|nr:ABC transporter substrate-binding protein [Pilimelia sp.]
MNRLSPQLRRALLVPALVAAVAAAAGCTQKESGTTTEAGVNLVTAGKLITCTHLPYEPFQYKDTTGKVVGFDVDLIDLVAKKLQVTQEIKDMPFEGIKSGQALNSGQCDLAAAGMTITEERRKVIDFSDPYFNATQAMLVNADSAYARLEDLAGKKVGVQAQTTGADYVDKQKKDAGLAIEVVSYKDLAALQQALATGQVEAAVNDMPVLALQVRKDAAKYKIGATFDTGEKYGFAVKKGGNPKLLETINKVLADARADGTYENVYKQWIAAS